MICPNCQNNCREGDQFCFRCGAALAAPPAPKKGRHIVPIAILMVLSILGIVLFFAVPMGDTQSETPWFQIDDGILFFDQSLYTGGSELTVPEVVNGQTVTAIGPQAFANCTDLTTVILPDTVTSIGHAAFSGCTAMRGIFLPEGVTRIEEQAFADCVRLEAITIPATVEAIGSGAFDGCEKLIYILFLGEYSRWETLYSDHINLKTHVYCTDGAYLHR